MQRRIRSRGVAAQLRRETRTSALSGIRLVFAFMLCSAVSLKLYLVTFDLLQNGDYSSLRERLRTMEARQTLANQWALRTVHSAGSLKNLLREFVDDGDRIVVAEVGSEWASRRAMENLGEV